MLIFSERPSLKQTNSIEQSKLQKAQLQSSPVQWSPQLATFRLRRRPKVAQIISHKSHQGRQINFAPNESVWDAKFKLASLLLANLAAEQSSLETLGLALEESSSLATGAHGSKWPPKEARLMFVGCILGAEWRLDCAHVSTPQVN